MTPIIAYAAFRPRSTEIETAKGADALDRRPQLKAAMKRASVYRCPIVVAKLELGIASRRAAARPAQYDEPPAVSAGLGPGHRPTDRLGSRPARPAHALDGLTRCPGRRTGGLLCGSTLPGRPGPDGSRSPAPTARLARSLRLPIPVRGACA